MMKKSSTIASVIVLFVAVVIFGIIFTAGQPMPAKLAAQPAQIDTESVLPLEDWNPCKHIADVATFTDHELSATKSVTIVSETCDDGIAHFYAGRKYARVLAKHFKPFGATIRNGVEVVVPANRAKP